MYINIKFNVAMFLYVVKSCFDTTQEFFVNTVLHAL